MGISDGRPTGEFNQGAQRAIEALGKYDRKHGGNLNQVLTNAHQIVHGADIKLEACHMIDLAKAIKTLEKDNPGIKDDMKALNNVLAGKIEGNPTTCKP